MYSFSKYKEQYRQNLRLAIPVALSQLGQIIVQIVDNAMVGQYGGGDPTPLAAVSFGGGVYFMSFLAIMGLTFGITPLVGELYVQNRDVGISKYLQNSIVLYCGGALLISIIQYAIIPLMHHMGQPHDVVEMAIPYYKTMVWSLLPSIIFFTFKQFLEGVGNTKIAMYVVIISNIVNIGLNYLLIGGECGAPEMGTLGAGIATLISRVLLSVLIVGYFLRSTQFAKYRELFSRFNFSKGAISRLFNLGLPISLQIFLEASSFITIGFMFGWFDAVAISANQIGVMMGNSSFMIIVAIGAATTIRVSHCYGRRDLREMRRASKAAWHLALVWNLSVAIFVLCFRAIIPQLFSANSEVVELASILMLTIAAYQITDGMQCVGVGILRGMQDMKVIPYISLFSYWVCNIPIAYLCAFTLGMGAKGLYMGFIVGFSVASFLIYLRIKHRQKTLLGEQERWAA